MSYIGQGLPADVFSGFTIDKFTGDGTANKALTLSKAPFSETTVLVTIDGVVQEPTDDFTVSGTTLTLVGTAANGSEINVTHLSGTVPSTLASKVDLNGVSDTLILDADADTTISADTDDQIDFKAGGTDIMSLTATTATFNDGVEITVNDNSDTIKLISTDDDGSVGPVLHMVRDSASPADGDSLGRIHFSGDNDAGEEEIFARIKVAIVDASNGSEDANMRFSRMIGGGDQNVLSFESTETVFNDDSKDIDFRVESDGQTHALFVDAGNNVIGMGVSNPGSFNASGNNLVIGTGSGNEGLTIYTGTTGTAHILFADGTSGAAAYHGYIGYTQNTGDLNFYTGGGGHRFQIQDDGTLLGSDTSIGALSSDQRLKKDIVDHTYDIAKFKQFKPRNYAWKYPDAHVGQPTTGFVAQEVETVDDSWVSENPFQEDALATPPNLTEEKALCDGGNQKTVKLGKKDAMYISVIQQLITRIEALEDA